MVRRALRILVAAAVGIGLIVAAAQLGRIPGLLAAGTVFGAGLFVNDRLPEETAAELRAVSVELEPASA